MYKPLKAHDAALVLIDQQIISMTTIKTQSPEVARHNTIALAKTASVLGIPSVWTSSTEDENEDWWMPGLEEINPEAYKNRIKRTGIVDSWNDARFVRAVEATGRRTLIMAGTTNDGCLLYTALNARKAGYEVHAVLDAAGSPFQFSEDAARVRMANEGVILTATNTVIGELALDWSTSTGSALRQILAETFTSTLGEFGLKK
ncbi:MULTISPECIES: isochorismatase family protein [unclassified Amycolatopsis]|uniref:isochorismatase family protein n=1 Tax=unclassified Amycolatopsis TaxID=2618356 RepID=UPI001C6A89EF|nr:isochorismatase family protein [Amycolatopsis sp. DSM 110486]QYN20383.1 isochorismatase family protein [Amycolatopsis sp. DSM 110486]